MKTRILKYAISGFVFLLLLLCFDVVQATTYGNERRDMYASIMCTSKKQLEILPGGVLGYSISQTASTIGRVGYAWFTFQTYCFTNSSYIQHYYNSGQYGQNTTSFTDYGASGNAFGGCPWGTNVQWQVLGNHEYSHSGYDPIQLSLNFFY
jgi:hypothetical protein